MNLSVLNDLTVLGQGASPQAPTFFNHFETGFGADEIARVEYTLKKKDLVKDFVLHADEIAKKEKMVRESACYFEFITPKGRKRWPNQKDFIALNEFYDFLQKNDEKAVFKKLRA